jgi:ribosomal protein L3
MKKKFGLALAVAGLAAIAATGCGTQVVQQEKPSSAPTTTQTTTQETKAPEQTPAPAEPSQPTTTQESKPEMTMGQENALQSAQDYLDSQAFSKQGLIEQLSSSAGEGFSKADATFAANHVDADWREEAVKSAQEYLDSQSFSRTGLIEQLSSSAGEGFTPAQARYAVSQVYGPDTQQQKSARTASDAGVNQDSSNEITYPYTDGGGAVILKSGVAIDKDGNTHSGAHVGDDGLIRW